MRSWPASEVEEWKIYCEYEPFPDPFWIGAQIACVVANSQRTKGRAYTIEDFDPRPRMWPKRPQSPEEMRSAFGAALREESTRHEER